MLCLILVLLIQPARLGRGTLDKQGKGKSCGPGSWRLRENVNSLDSDVTSGPEVGTTQGRKGDNEPDCEPKSGQGRRRSRAQIRRRGRKRGPRSLGRYPFLTELRVYLDEVYRAYAETTVYEKERKLCQVHRVLQELKSKGIIETTSPRRLGQKEIWAFHDWMNGRNGLRSRPLAPGTQKKLLHHLNGFLTHLGNGVISEMVAKKQLRIPKEPKIPGPSFDEGYLDSLMKALQKMAENGSKDALAVFGHAVFCAYAGTRLKEVRLAQIGHFSTDSWVLVVYHPKGEDSWADPREVMVCGPGRKFVSAYLALRKRLLAERGHADNRNVPLVPWFKGSEVREWSDNNLRRAKEKVLEQMKVKYDFRIFRRSYGQNMIDRGVRVDTTSKAMGHASVSTTQRYYVCLKNKHVFDEIERAYASKKRRKPNSG